MSSLPQQSKTNPESRKEGNLVGTGEGVGVGAHRRGSVALADFLCCLIQILQYLCPGCCNVSELSTQHTEDPGGSLLISPEMSKIQHEPWLSTSILPLKKVFLFLFNILFLSFLCQPFKTVRVWVYLDTILGNQTGKEIWETGKEKAIKYRRERKGWSLGICRWCSMKDKPGDWWGNRWKRTGETQGEVRPMKQGKAISALFRASAAGSCCRDSEVSKMHSWPPVLFVTGDKVTPLII